MSDQHRGVPEHVLRAGDAAAAASRLVDAIRSAEQAATAPDPARGQLWRASWDGATQLVLVLRVTGSSLANVAPVTTDPPACDDSSIVLDAELTVLSYASTVWGGLAREIPFCVFDLLIGQVPAAPVDATENIASGNYAGTLPDGVRVGTPVTSPFDRVAEIRAELSDTLVHLGRAAWAPQVLGSAQTIRDLLQGRNDVAALMKALVKALALEQPAVMNILVGKRPVTPEQASAIADIAGLTEQQVLSAVPALPADLVSELDRPRWRRPLRAQRKSGEAEAATRLTVAYGTLALAARQTGQASVPSWPHRIRQYLATHPPVDGSDP